MNYATWKLNFADSFYGTGPEDKIAQLGFSAEGGWVFGEVQTDGIILGYVTEPQDESQLVEWNFSNVKRYIFISISIFLYQCSIRWCQYWR